MNDEYANEMPGSTKYEFCLNPVFHIRVLDFSFPDSHILYSLMDPMGQAP
jgi:hypothetical protein